MDVTLLIEQLLDSVANPSAPELWTLGLAALVVGGLQVVKKKFGLAGDQVAIISVVLSVLLGVGVAAFGIEDADALVILEKAMLPAGAFEVGRRVLRPAVRPVVRPLTRGASALKQLL